jgi:hypothetical protein
LKDHQDNPKNLKSLDGLYAEAEAKIQKAINANGATVKAK